MHREQYREYADWYWCKWLRTKSAFVIGDYYILLVVYFFFSSTWGELCWWNLSRRNCHRTRRRWRFYKSKNSWSGECMLDCKYRHYLYLMLQQPWLKLGRTLSMLYLKACIKICALLISKIFFLWGYLTLLPSLFHQARRSTASAFIYCIKDLFQHCRGVVGYIILPNFKHDS